MKKPAAPSPPPGTTPPTTDGKAAAKEAAPPLSPEEAFAYGAFPQPPSFKDMLGSGGMYAEAGTFDQYVKRGKRLLTVFGSLPTLREGQPSVGAWRLQRREVWEDNKYWHKWGTLGDLHRFPLMDLPYDTHLREADDYLTAFSIKADIFRLNQYSPIKAVGARHWTRLNAPDHWKADALLDRIISGPLRFVQAKWWTAFPSFSLLGSRRSITMRLAFQAPNGEVLEEVPFNAVLQGWGPQAELSYRIQRGVLLPHPKAEDAPELQKIPRAINHEGGFDFTFLWLHFGWLRLRAFPSRYMFYWGVNFPLPSLGVQSIEPGQLVRDAEEMAFGWDRHVALRTYEDMLMHEAFPITAFTVGTSGTAPIRKFLADEEELLLKSWLQRYRDKQKAEADKAARLTEQAKGDSAILAEQVKREAERKDQEARVREEEARFAAAIQKVLPDLTADPEIAKKVDAKEKEAAAALLNPRAWAPFDRTDAKLLQTLAVERKFKEYYLNRLAERFDLWLDTEDNWALDEDVQEFLSFNRASWRGGSGPLDIERLEDDEGDDQEDIRRGVASNTLGFEFPPETMGSRGWMEWYKEENELQDFYTQWWINVLWDCREAWQKRREQYAVARRTPAWLSAKGVEQQKADYKEQEEADKQAFTESFDADELRDDVEDLEEEDELEAYEERLQKLEREDAGEPEREGEANEEEGSDPRSKVLRTRRRPKPPPKREEGSEF